MKFEFFFSKYPFFSLGKTKGAWNLGFPPLFCRIAHLTISKSKLFQIGHFKFFMDGKIRRRWNLKDSIKNNQGRLSNTLKYTGGVYMGRLRFFFVCMRLY